ncbi:division/cell wall cluster transcriptional repressor MraZ [Quadrisphaera sp. DSM 44207]|uniref:division/cell wall cluster transcriptional repressor MraZ n=1 Tax=Quadrisphaera sp. DSM 44207 TaxID=1881057 RepID=UPI00088D3EF5|nr:division/cell wall cluster transcriptional repressor MraZ [Quadrisphaera sp. DSM 44207]SDQ53814.1 MraZ protein [Quadrisphaera sp. DSM 44207]
MFLGTHTPRLDDKGRLILPARFREQLADGLVLTRGQDRCLYVFPVAEFERMHEQLRQAPVTSKQARDYLRVLLSGASDEVPDRQGRITVPPALRSYAGLTRDCAVIGAGPRVEIWDERAWNAYLAEQEGAFASTAEEVVPGLF